MAENDLLSALLQAWREDIDSVPFPQFSELLIPHQQNRSLVEHRFEPDPSVARVTNATRRTDG